MIYQHHQNLHPHFPFLGLWQLAKTIHPPTSLYSIYSYFNDDQKTNTPVPTQAAAPIYPELRM